MPRLTKKLTDGVQVKTVHHYLWDDQLPGFGLRVLPSGNKTFLVQYRFCKRIRKLIIGRYPVVSVEEARVEATTILAAVRRGEDPMANRRDPKGLSTVAEFAKRYLDEYCAAHQKPSTQYSNKLMLDRYILPAIGSRDVRSVNRADIANLHLSMAKTPILANRTLGVISKMFNLAELWLLRDDGTNPCRRIKKYSERKRDRYLSYEEVTALGSILQEYKNYPDQNLAAIYCLQLLMLTGCRSGEIRTLQWKFIDFDRQRIFLPDSKTGARTIYLGPSATSLLHEIKACPARPLDNPYIIWGRLPNEPLRDLKGPWEKFRRLAKLEDVRIHDLRHSFASFAVNQNISLATIGKLLGHTNVQTTARYAHLMERTTSEAADVVSSRIGSLMAIQSYENVAATSKRSVEDPGDFIPKTNVPMPRYFTSDQAALYLGLDPKSMKDWRYRKAGPSYDKIGNRIRYKQDDLDAFLKLHTIPT